MRAKLSQMAFTRVISNGMGRRVYEHINLFHVHSLPEAGKQSTVWIYISMGALDNLLGQHIWRGPALVPFSPTVSTSYAELDRELPGGGWPTGVLTEVLGLQ